MFNFIKKLKGIFFRDKKFTFYRQFDRSDCGPTCLKMICKHYGKNYPIDYLREKAHIMSQGITFLALSDAAEELGFQTLGAKVTLKIFKDQVPLPCIAYWRQRHFVVVYKVTKDKVYVADPDFGLIIYSDKDFTNGWLDSKNPTKDDEGLVLMLEATPEFYKKEDEVEKKNSIVKFLYPYFKPYSKYIVQIFIGAIVGMLLQLAFPFLTQSLVDYGIKNQDISFIYLILAAQLMLFFSQTAIEVVRTWILMYVGSRINITIISNYLTKLLKLKMGFFDSKQPGDLYQRIEDNSKIERFLTSTSLNIFFSVINAIILGLVIGLYNLKIFIVFLIGTIIYIGWVLTFTRKREVLNFKSFDEMASNSSNLWQLIHGIQEIKVNNSETRRRWEWEAIRIKLYHLSIKTLSLTQYQELGGRFINEVKNIFILFFAATSVIKGEISLGVMLAIQFIIGQLSVPINNIVVFIQNSQDANLSLRRLEEIFNKKDEESSNQQTQELPDYNSIVIKDLNFRYGTKSSEYILSDINLEIPRGKVTAIVGASGSGKTTLLKLLLKFYDIEEGSISVNNINLNQINTKFWRSKCGAVMQDGFIFGNSVARNISESDSTHLVNKAKLMEAVKIANIQEFIEELPGGYKTKIGPNGLQISGGQKQRVVIARAVYKNPEFVFFDEATSALDANNEKIIMNNLEEFFAGRTVVVIAHRLSTVKNADQIVVLDKGKIIEIGNHKELAERKGAYYSLVKNQLELGK